MSKYLNHTKSVGDCLEWIRCLNTDGYPRAGTKENSNIKVHREVFFDFNGYYPEVVRHSCDNTKCLNPDHLLEGNQLDNVLDRVIRGRTYNHVTEEEIKQVTALRQTGMTYKEISMKLGINFKRVEYIATRKVGVLFVV